MKDLNNAFPDTPEYVRHAIHMGLNRARRRQALKRRLFALASAAAVLAVMLGALTLAVNERRLAGTRLRSPNPGPLAHGYATDGPTPKPLPKPTPEPTAVPLPTATPMPTPVSRPTERPTPMPSVLVTALPTARPVVDAGLFTPMPTAYYPAKAAVYEAAIVPEMSEAADSEVVEQFVYSTKNGKYYHGDRSCSGMRGASARLIAEAEKLGQSACPICMPEDPTVWMTRAGKYYHDSEDCSGMRYAVAMPESEAIASGRKLCPVCQSSRVRTLRTDFYSTDGGKYYHADPECSGMLGAVRRTEEELQKLGQGPCPVCVGNP